MNIFKKKYKNVKIYFVIIHITLLECVVITVSECVCVCVFRLFDFLNLFLLKITKITCIQFIEKL